MKSNEYYPSSYTGPLPRLQPSERIALMRKTKEEEEEEEEEEEVVKRISIIQYLPAKERRSSTSMRL